ncbi:hypothetical protein [Ferrimonas balearica]|nr:hypothetical protein [Ferrimonas balearica]
METHSAGNATSKATVLLLPPTGWQGEALLASYRALAMALAQHTEVTVQWAGYQQLPNQLAFKAIPHFLARHPGTTVISHCPLPPSWPLAGARVILTLLPHQLANLPRRSQVDDIWLLDGAALPLLTRLKLALWHRPRPTTYSLWRPPVTGTTDALPGYLFLLSQRLSPAERELVSEVAQVVSIQRQCPVYLWLNGSPPPGLRGVTLLPEQDETALQQHLNQARAIISDQWHWLLCGAHAERPTLALTEPGTPLQKGCHRLGIGTESVQRQALTQAVLSLTEAPIGQPANQLDVAIKQLAQQWDGPLGSDAVSGYTSP